MPRKPPPVAPTCFVPSCPADFVGQADRMRPGHAFLGTTNLDVAGLTERFQTRFQSGRLQPPENEILVAFLARRWAHPSQSPDRSPKGPRATLGRRWLIWRCGLDERIADS